MGRESSEQRERGQSSGGTFLMVCAILPEWWAPEENVGCKDGGQDCFREWGPCVEVRLVPDSLGHFPVEWALTMVQRDRVPAASWDLGMPPNGNFGSAGI